MTVLGLGSSLLVIIIIIIIIIIYFIKVTLLLQTACHKSEIFVALNFHEFSKKICLCENIIVNITAYSVIFFDTFLIKRSFLQKFSPMKISDYMVLFQ